MPLKILAFIFIFSVESMDNNEMIIEENQSWILVHYYVVVGWKRMPICFHLNVLRVGLLLTLKLQS